MEILRITLFLFLLKFHSCQNETDPVDKKTLEKQQELDTNYTFVDWLLQGEHSDKVEYQTFDGWYNNPWHLSLGSTGTLLAQDALQYSHDIVTMLCGIQNIVATSRRYRKIFCVNRVYPFFTLFTGNKLSVADNFCVRCLIVYDHP
ncbi:hypothetical protein AVEN_190897-1 [Araneus ventricosus]|uniref:Uncharacterized protein n=1 Tax=Araneus ventricosus TaxID=182803 RepID=A0A4Y2CS38_ARAVE|nr:hypothetical protein AVEN_190897-1 [Araneus ventricosus]